MKTAWIALAMMVVCGAWADSDPPVPAPTEQSCPTQKKATQPSHAANYRKHVSDKGTPLVVSVDNAPVIKVENCPKSQEEARQPNEKQNEKTARQWWLTADGLTALFTGLLVAIGVASAAVLAIQSWLLGRQVELAREEFNATHRPRLTVREVMLFPFPLQTPTEETGIRPTVKVRCVIANTGDGDGNIQESHFELQDVSGDYLMPLQPVEGANPLGPTKLIPGTHKFWEVRSTIGRIAFMKIVNSRNSAPIIPRRNLYFRGFIVYADINGVWRRMAFCRRFDPDTDSFRRIDNPDYEYAD